MINEKDLADALRALTRKPTINHVCKVLEVTGKICRVEPIDGGAEITGVRLSPVTDNTNEGLLITPEVNSYVMVSEVKINNSESKYYVSGWSRITDIKMLTTTGDSFSMVKAETLITELNKTRSLLNAVLTVINGAAIPEPGNGSPSALQAALKTAVTSQELGVFTNIKNDKIKHN